MTIKIGTANYRTEWEAKKAYGSDYNDALAEGRIIVGKPTLKQGESLLVNQAGRYIIDTGIN